MNKDENPIYDKNTLEFVTVVLEYCSLVETAGQYTLFDFTDRATKILPLLYLKATLIPELELSNDTEPELTITEEVYETVRNQLTDILGEHDIYLETFHPDMQYSDAPIAAFISENLADIYQDTGNFVSLFRQGSEEVIHDAIAICQINFREYWGQRLLNALKALHAIHYNNDDNFEMTE